MKLGMEEGFGPLHIVLEGDPAPPPKKWAQRPIFSPCLLWPNGRPSQLLLSTFYNTAASHLGFLKIKTFKCRFDSASN